MLSQADFVLLWLAVEMKPNVGFDETSKLGCLITYDMVIVDFGSKAVSHLVG